MPYNQILSLMIALLIIVGAVPEETPRFSLWHLAMLWMGKTAVWAIIAWRILKSSDSAARTSYILDKLQWTAMAMLAMDFFILDIKTYLITIPGSEKFPTITEVSGLLMYFFYLAVLWTANWRILSVRGLAESGCREDLGLRLRIIIPALVPYLLLALLGDMAGLIPSPAVQDFLNTSEFRLVYFGLFVALIIFLVPAIIPWIWKCRPFPQGPLRKIITDSLEKSGVRCAEILLWPLGRGRVCTAAVLGLVPRFRYILLTPCLVEYLHPAEIEAVLAHEVGHIRYRHLLWYVVFLGAYSAVLFSLLDPLWTWMLSRHFTMEFLVFFQDMPQSVSSLLALLPMVILMLLYFRLMMGYFMRNFERQADLHVFDVQGHPANLINALEKVALVAGGIREQPSWHHFGIAERVDFLQRTAAHPELKARHNRKLRMGKAVFLMAAATMITLSTLLPTQTWKATARSNITRLYFEQLMGRGEQQPEWYLFAGQILENEKEYEKALQAYHRALDLDPEDPEILNSIAWLFATAEDPEFKRPREALMYAIQAARIKPAAHILDTLAESFFINGYSQKAIELEMEALSRARNNREYYQAQLEKFRSATGTSKEKDLTGDQRQETD